MCICLTLYCRVHSLKRLQLSVTDAELDTHTTHMFNPDILGHVAGVLPSFLECGEIFFTLESTWWLMKC